MNNTYYRNTIKLAKIDTDVDIINSKVSYFLFAVPRADQDK